MISETPRGKPRVVEDFWSHSFESYLRETGQLLFFLILESFKLTPNIITIAKMNPTWIFFSHPCN